MDQRQQYLAFKEVVDLAIYSGGTIFGGFPRDFLRKEHFCKEFYKTHKKEDFANPEVYPETVDRLLLPKDLDICFKTRADYRSFRARLKGAFYRSTVTGIDNIYTNDRPGVHHIKLQAVLSLDIGRVLRSLSLPRGVAQEIIKPQLVERMQGMEINATPINMDILISSREPPFADLDFECNGLIMNKDGIHLCEDLKIALNPFGVHRKFMKVIDDIEHKKAIVVNLKSRRWDKMEEKGWDLFSKTVEKVNKVGEECLICLQAIDPTDVYKLECCSACYHFDCLSKQITYPGRGIADSGVCTHCRQVVVMSELEVGVFGALIHNA